MKSGADRPTAPPVWLPAEAELARDALATPLLSRAARLARWAGPGVPVGAGGELLPEQRTSAAAELGLDGEESAEALAEDAWHFAVDAGLVEIAEDERPDPASDRAGTATEGPELARLAAGDPAEALRVWSGGLEAVLEDAATPSLQELLGDLEGAVGEDGEIDPAAVDLDALEWDPEQEAEFLDTALGNLYLLAATDEAVAAGAMAPLPVVAAAMVLEEDVAEPSAEDLAQVSAVMMRLDERFRVLAGTGLLEYEPVDDALFVDEEELEAEPDADGALAEFARVPDGGAAAPAEGADDAAYAEGAEDADDEADEEDLTRYGQVRLTPLGVYGVRQRMLEAGIDAPLVGDLTGAEAGTLLAALPGQPPAAAREEAQRWVAEREPLAAARELLAAARGRDERGPGRRLGCQLVLTLLDAQVEPALREVLDDPELGGLARVWLAERECPDVPPPSEELVFWLTIDTLAAQLTAHAEEESPEELTQLVADLVAQHGDFFDRAWRTDHPATAAVLEAVGRLHPDRELAKNARKAAFKSRSRD